MTPRLIVLIAASASLPVCAQECYTVDGSRGSVSYEIKQAGAPFRGNFRRFGGEICLSAERTTRIEIWLDPASLESGLHEVDVALKDKDFFAVNQYPRVAYTSEFVEARGNTQLAHGMLQMKGKRRNLDVPFSLQHQGASFMVSGTVTLNRLDYGIGTGEWSDTTWLSGEVKVDFRATLSGK